MGEFISHSGLYGIVISDNVLEHRNHKYINKKMINGKWRYYYEETVIPEQKIEEQKIPEQIIEKRKIPEQRVSSLSKKQQREKAETYNGRSEDKYGGFDFSRVPNRDTAKSMIADRNRVNGYPESAADYEAHIYNIDGLVRYYREQLNSLKNERNHLDDKKAISIMQQKINDVTAAISVFVEEEHRLNAEYQKIKKAETLNKVAEQKREQSRQDARYNASKFKAQNKYEDAKRTPTYAYTSTFTPIKNGKQNHRQSVTEDVYIHPTTGKHYNMRRKTYYNVNNKTARNK